MFKALIELGAQEPDPSGLRLPVAAGKQVSVEIRQGTRTVMGYLLSPVQRVASEAGGGAVTLGSSQMIEKWRVLLGEFIHGTRADRHDADTVVDLAVAISAGDRAPTLVGQSDMVRSEFDRGTYGPVRTRNAICTIPRGVSRGLVTMAALSVSACASTAQGQPQTASTSVQTRHELAAGQGLAVCEAYLSRLRWGGDRLTLVGKAPLDAVDFEQRSLSDEENGELLRSIREFLWTRDVNPARLVAVEELAKWSGSPEQISKARSNFVNVVFPAAFEGAFGSAIARIDIDNDGTVEPVLSARLAEKVLVLTEDERSVDVAKTEMVLEHLSRRDSGWPDVRPRRPDDRPLTQPFFALPDGYASTSYGVYTYEGRIYWDLWWRERPEYGPAASVSRGEIRVFSAEAGQSREICRIRPRREWVRAMGLDE